MQEKWAQNAVTQWERISEGDSSLWVFPGARRAYLADSRFKHLEKAFQLFELLEAPKLRKYQRALRSTLLGETAAAGSTLPRPR
jgi:hypothetical protein